MKKWFGLAAGCWLAGIAAGAEGSPAFVITTEQTTCPEYGTVLHRQVLVCDGLRLAFQAPAGWKASADAQRRTLILEAPAADAQIRLRLILPERQGTNAPAVLPPAPELKTVVASLAPQAEILGEGSYPASGSMGKSCDFQFAQAGRIYQGRVAWFTFPQCHVEVAMTTSGALAKKHPFFIEVLNSLELRSLLLASSLTR